MSKYHFHTVIALFSIFLLVGCGSGVAGSGSSGAGSGGTAPSLSFLTPANIPLGSAALTLTAIGSNFSPGSQINWNGAPLATTYAGPTSLNAQVPASNLVNAATVQITITSPGPNGGTSNAVAFLVAHLTPQVTSISPATADAGSPALTLTVTGSNFDSSVQIQWNGIALPTTLVSSTQITAQVPASDLATASSAQVTASAPAPGGGQSTAQTFYINSGATKMAVIRANANDIVWDPIHSRIYASLAAANNGSNANSIAAIDPLAGTIQTVQAAGTSPNLLAVSSDASYLWVGEDGNSAVQRFTLPNLTPDITIPMPIEPTLHIPMTAIGLEAAPGLPHTAAILIGSQDTSPPDIGGLFIYDDATPRAGNIPPISGFVPFADLSSVQWGADASTLYGQNGSSTGFDFVTAGVNSAGLTIQKDYSSTFQTFSANIHYDKQTGYVYGDNGQVVDPATGIQVGNFFQLYNGVGPGGQCVVDSSLGVVFFLNGGSSNYSISAFDQKTYRLLRRMDLPPIDGVVVNFIRWGTAGLAINTVPEPYATVAPILGSIYLIDGAFVNGSQPADFTSGTSLQALPAIASISPQSATIGSGDLQITVTGSNFENGSFVYWGGSPLNTTYVNAGLLQATIPSKDLAALGASFISVSNGSALTQSAANLTFTVLPANSGVTPVNLSSFDVAWDKKSNLLFAPAWGADAQYPNSIVAIDPTSGKIVESQLVGADPYLVRTTGDGNYVYTATLSSNSVTQLRLPGLTSPLTWNLGRDTSRLGLGTYTAFDLQPAPNASQTTAVLTGFYQYIPERPTYGDHPGGGVTIFDNNVARPTAALEGPLRVSYGSLQWGSDNATLYAAGSDLYYLSVDSSGVTQTRDDLSAFEDGILNTMHYDAGTGYLYADTGQVINPATGNQVGSFSSSGLAVPDSSLNRVFIIGQTKSQSGNTWTYTIASFDQTKFTPVSSMTISIVGFPAALIRWGASGLALVTEQDYSDLAGHPWGMLYIINNPAFVSGSAQANAQPQLVTRTWQKPRPPLPSVVPTKARNRQPERAKMQGIN